MKKLAVVSAVIAAFGFVNAASAADMPVKAPMAPVAAPYNWTGVYIGINGGGGWGKESWLDNTGAPSVSVSPQGGVFGGQLGFRYQWNQLVIGVEGTWDWAGLRDSVTAFGAFGEEFKVKSIYTVTGQVGCAIDRWLPYVKGGWAGATNSLALSEGGLGEIANISQTSNGWTIGGGIDYAVWQNLILGIEYDHFDLNYASSTTPTIAGTYFVTNTSRLTIHQVVARLSYKFWTP